MQTKPTNTKIKHSEHIYALKVKTEGNGLGVLKTIIVIALIALQLGILIASYFHFLLGYRWYIALSFVLTAISCFHVLSTNYHGQAKATWILFLIVCFSFGFIFYFMSDKRVLFGKSKKKYTKIFNQTKDLKPQLDETKINNDSIKSVCNYLYSNGSFTASNSSNTNFFPSGASLYDSILEDIKKAKYFIFIEYFIISNGVLLQRFLNILKQKASEGVDVRIIYDDMGSHGTLKRKTKKEIMRSGIKLKDFNRLIPVLNIALNLRNHRKIVCIDGKIAYTGGANLADEYVNEKRMHGYWKDCGIKIQGDAVDNLTISFLQQWQFLTNEQIEYKNYINKFVPQKHSTDKDKTSNTNEIVVPFVSGPNYNHSIAQDMYASMIANAKKYLYIMTPYFVPDETILNMLINKARSGVEIKIILPDVADKKFVYVVSRNNAEKLLDCGVKVYTMTHSFVHSKVVINESSAIVGSINMDLRSFYQQFESAVFTSENKTRLDILNDFENTINHCKEITSKNRRRNSVFYRALAGVFNIISPFM